MQSVLIIIAKAILASGLLYGYYFLMLRNRKFHQYNRFYILAAVIISLIVPFIKIPAGLFAGSRAEQLAFRNFEIIRLLGGEDDAVVAGITGTHVPVSSLLLMTYLFVSGILLYFFCRSIILIRRIWRNSPSERYNGLTIYFTNEDGTPFSFFRKIFWNNALPLTSREGEQVLQHEMYHVHQYHSADMLLMHLLQLFAWFNPFYYLARKELQTIHEFLADQHALDGHEHLAYAELLVQQSIRAKRFQLSNHFFQHQIKRRVSMIINKPLKQPGYFSRILAIPVIVLFCMAVVSFTQRNQTNINGIHARLPFTVVVDAGHGGSDPGVSVDGISEQQLALEIAQQIKTLSAEYNVNVELTRTGTLPAGTLLPPNLRTEFINALQPKLIVSIHFGASSDKGVNGIDIYVPNDGGSNPFVSASKTAASMIASTIERAYKVNGVMQRANKGINVLDKSVCPAVMIECGYLTNAADRLYILKKENQEIVARKILEGMVGFNQHAQGGTVKADTTLPMYPGGAKGWQTFLTKNLRYPQLAQDNEIKGKVTVRFMVNEDGTLENLMAMNDPGAGLAQEAVRIIFASGKWQPATVDGKPIKVQFEKTITFQLEAQ